MCWLSVVYCFLFSPDPAIYCLDFVSGRECIRADG